MLLKEFLGLNLDNVFFKIHNGCPWFESEAVYDSRMPEKELPKELLQKKVNYLFIDDNVLIIEIV